MELSEYWTCGNCDAINRGDVFYGKCWQCQINWEKVHPKPETQQICETCKSSRGFHNSVCPLFKRLCEYCGSQEENKHSDWCDRPKKEAPEKEGQ